MGSSWKIGRILGVDVYIHWAFLVLLAWILISGFLAERSIVQALLNTAFVLVLFGCVVLHELGHALAARAYGIATRDITLLPIGGVARLERMPRRPLHELVVALAGPLVNVVIAGSLGIVRWQLHALSEFATRPPLEQDFLTQLLWVNLMLALFNMLPAFPLDGGRVLRALLAMFLDYNRATQVAARIGQLIALGLILLGWFWNPFLILIGLFVFLAGSAEASSVQLRESLRDVRVRDGMLTRFRVVPSHLPLRYVAARLLDDQQQDFPVVRDGQVLGMLRRESLATGIQASGGEPLVTDVMQRDIPRIDADEPLIDVLERTSGPLSGAMPVQSGGQLVGLLDLRQALELARARTMLRTVVGGPDPWAEYRDLPTGPQSLEQPNMEGRRDMS